MTALSIAICTLNRAESLRAMLRSLEAQHLPAIHEVLLIDNGSTDHTREVIDGFPSLPIRYLVEERRGLAHARNLALATFSGDHLLFLDDDVRLAPDCVAHYAAAIASRPDADFFAGRILPDWPGAAPAWAQAGPLPLLDGVLVWIDLGLTSRALADDDPGPFGASFAVSRRLVDRVGAFDTSLGAKGARRGRGEETEWFARARRFGAQGVYVGDALCHHRVDMKRLGLLPLFEYGVESGAAYRRIVGTPLRGSVLRFASFALRGAVQFCRGRGDRFRQCVINMGIEYDALRH